MTLKRQWLKKYGKITGQEALRYKQGKGTRWVTLHNLVTMIRFNNSTMKSERFSIEGIRKAACNLPLQMCQCLQRYVLVDVIPCSLALEKVSLLLPEAIPTTETALNNF